MEKYINLILPAIFTAIGSAIGASVYKMASNVFKKKDEEQKARDEKLFSKIDNIQSEIQMLLRYNLQQSAIIGTILDALKTNHINGNIERAESQLENAQSELNNSLIKHATKGNSNDRK